MLRAESFLPQRTQRDATQRVTEVLFLYFAPWFYAVIKNFCVTLVFN